ncbi:GNAT family N-acetyltransferase [Actinomadura scrupuli]|uniref:GNAT family N-acetyltransferase n=1 Tax=Actinomadura scrupuli TaxID=559629 RepID=UPI003D97EF51
MTFEPGTVLTTRRLVLRPFTGSDIDDVLEAGRDPEMLQWMPFASRRTPAQARDWCTRLAHHDPEGQIHFAVVGRSGRCDGSVGLDRADWAAGQAEIGYWIAPWARHKGYATEAVRAVVAYGQRTGLHRIELLAAHGNLSSLGVAERAGFARAEGVAPGGRADMALLTLETARETAPGTRRGTT